jgi:hypothetical protein
MKIFFVGVNNKPGMAPLDSKSKTGKLIDITIKKFPSITCIKTNLFDVEDLPKEEWMKNDLAYQWWIQHQPQENDIAVLLGKVVQKYFPNGINAKCRKVFSVHPGRLAGLIQQATFLSTLFNEISKQLIDYEMQLY